MFKRATALGLSVSAIASLGRAYGASAQEATPAGGEPGYSLVAPTNLRTDLSGSIAVVLGSDGPTVPWEEAAVNLFTETTGVAVERISGAESATDRLANYQQLLGAGASDVDAMMIDVIWPGILAPHAVDLTAALEAQGYEYFERIVTNNTVNDVLVGIPWFTDAGLLYYRQDLLDKQTILDGERADNPDFQGFVWQGAAYEGLTCDALEWQVSQGGGNIIEADGTVTINNPQAIAAFERAAGWVGNISPTGVTDYMEEDSRGVWQGGNAAFMRNWPYAFALGDAADSVIKGKFNVTLVPMGEGEGAQHADTLGGWQMMVSTYSENQDAAVEFARYMTSMELQKSFTIEHSRLPTIPELYEDSEVLALYPFFGTLKEVFLGGAVARPSTVSADLYNEVSTAYFTSVNQIITGQAEAASAVADLEGQLNDIMAEL
jgi:trehalose/maltose transport system substrate-binding protein